MSDVARPAGRHWRHLAVASGIFGTLLICGELARSWGVRRPLPLILDDVTMGGGLIAAAILAWRGHSRANRLLAAAWGMLAGMLYMSFFGKLAAPQTVNAGNFSMSLLTGLVGLAWLVALAGMVITIALNEAER